MANLCLWSDKYGGRVPTFVRYEVTSFRKAVASKGPSGQKNIVHYGELNLTSTLIGGL